MRSIFSSFLTQKQHPVDENHENSYNQKLNLHQNDVDRDRARAYNEKEKKRRDFEFLEKSKRYAYLFLSQSSSILKKKLNQKNRTQFSLFFLFSFKKLLFFVFLFFYRASKAGIIGYSQHGGSTLPCIYVYTCTRYIRKKKKYAAERALQRAHAHTDTKNSCAYEYTHITHTTQKHRHHQRDSVRPGGEERFSLFSILYLREFITEKPCASRLRVTKSHHSTLFN